MGTKYFGQQPQRPRVYLTLAVRPNRSLQPGPTKPNRVCYWYMASRKPQIRSDFAFFVSDLKLAQAQKKPEKGRLHGPEIT